jgi:hypothetical protein
VKALDRQRILESLIEHNWNQTRAAQALQMPRRTFVSKLDLYGIPRPQKGAPGPELTDPKATLHGLAPPRDHTD